MANWSQDNSREIVVITRELHDGTITEERLERWLAGF